MNTLRKDEKMKGRTDEGRMNRWKKDELKKNEGMMRKDKTDEGIMTGRGGTLGESKPFNWKVVVSNPALAAM